MHCAETNAAAGELVDLAAGAGAGFEDPVGVAGIERRRIQATGAGQGFEVEAAAVVADDDLDAVVAVTSLERDQAGRVLAGGLALLGCRSRSPGSAWSGMMPPLNPSLGRLSGTWI